MKRNYQAARLARYDVQVDTRVQIRIVVHIGRRDVNGAAEHFQLRECYRRAQQAYQILTPCGTDLCTFAPGNFEPNGCWLDSKSWILDDKWVAVSTKKQCDHRRITGPYDKIGDIGRRSVEKRKYRCEPVSGINSLHTNSAAFLVDPDQPKYGLAQGGIRMTGESACGLVSVRWPRCFEFDSS